MVVSAQDNDTFINANQENESIFQDEIEIYVSNDGDDEFGNGSSQSPFSSIGYAVGAANNNSRIILKDGVYKGNVNTNIVIDKTLTIEASCDATINGEGKNFFFRINKGSSLTLNNIKFINGFTDSFSQLAVISNQGNLVVNSSSFTSMNCVMSAFFNEGSLIIDNTEISKVKSANMAQAVTNIGTCTISNSKFTDSDSLDTVYNFNDIRIINSKFTSLTANDKYSPVSYNPGFILIQNSTLAQVSLENSTCRISDSSFGGRFTLKGMDVNIKNTLFASISSYNILSVSDSNFTAVHSTFGVLISSSRSAINITYSAILNSVSGSGISGYLYAPYNWWGINSGPVFQYFKNNYVKYWAVAAFEVEDSNLSVGTHSKFISSLNKWCDGNSTFSFRQNEYLPARTVSFETQNGKFMYSSANIRNNFSNYLINNNLDCNVFSVIDNQRLSLTIGNGLSAYSYFVAPWGHDGPEDGSLEKPFASLQYAVGKAGNGNTICLLEGNHTGNANSNVVISKNLTVVGMGDVNLVRANSANLFKIQEWGSLVIKNVNFKVDVREFANNLFVVSGGNLTVFNCTFDAVTSSGIFSTSSGVEKLGMINIIDTSFSDIVGSVGTGVAMYYVENSHFERISNFYTSRGLENYNSVFAISGSIEVYNSTFDSVTMGIINLHPYSYSGNSLLGVSYSQYHEEYGRYAYISGSTFKNNLFCGIGSYSSNGIGLDIHESYGSFNGFIVNSTFINNVGLITLANEVSDSSFFENSGEGYYAHALVRADSVRNSLFANNSNMHIYGDSYIGEGIVTAQSVLNSTFINNTAAFGGAVSDTKEIHYSVFVNNSALYKGNDIYSSSGDVDYSANWWGDNQKPDENRIFIFLGSLKMDNWVIMSLESVSISVIKASLNTLRDDAGNFKELDFSMQPRPVYFMIGGGNVTPNFTYLSNNVAFADISIDFSSNDFKAYARIDNQLLDVDVRNTHTRIMLENVTVKGKNGKFEMDLINVNGHRISNQTLTVTVTDTGSLTKTFDVKTDDNGHASFNIDYPVGKYGVNVDYMGDGYFDGCNASASVEVRVSATSVVSYNCTYYGKNNLFYGILKDEYGKNLANGTISFRIVDIDGEEKTVSTKTDIYGRGEVKLSLDVGEYDIFVEFGGDSWYLNSSSKSHIVVNPANSTIIAPNVTFYGEGNVYNITLKDVYGNLISGENIAVRISFKNLSDNFILKTDDKGTARLTINYMPGSYDVRATYAGDKIYGPAVAESVISVEKVLTVVSGFHYSTIPLNGIYTVVLSDMYGRRVNNESVILNCYQGKLIKSYNASTDANGEASFVVDLGEGNYLATFDYAGNLWYADSTGAATIVVSRDVQLKTVSMNASDMIQYYGENKYFIIEFNDPNAYSQYGKEITVTLTSGTWSRAYKLTTDVFGLARLQIDLNPGEYVINYKYSNDYYNIFSSGSNNITVYKMPITVLAGDLIMNVGESREFSVVLHDINNASIKNMQVHMKVNGNEYDVVSDNDGKASLPILLDVGKYTLTYSVKNPNYIFAEGSSTILVVDSNKTSTEITGEDINTWDTETINYTARLTDLLGNGIASSHITLEISASTGEPVENLSGTTDAEGRFTFMFNLTYGRYIAKLYYKGSSIYLQSNALNEINVETKDNRTKTYVYSGDVQIESTEKYYIILHDANGTLISGREITFMIGNESYVSRTNQYGKAFLNAGLSPGAYSVKVIFGGDDIYMPVSSMIRLYVSSAVTKIYAPPLTKYYRNGTQFHALLVNNFGNPLFNKTVSVVLENKTYNCTTDRDGWISLKIDLKPGKYDVECYYTGIDLNESSSNKTTISVLSTIEGSDEVKYYGDSPYLTIKFIEGSGKLITNTQFVINIDGTNYADVIDKTGIYHFTSNLKSGSHIITVYNPYDGLSASYKLTVMPTVYVDTLVKVLGDGKQYVATFFDKNGDALSNRNVEVIINGVKYAEKTDDFGEIGLNMEFAPKNYLVTVINPATGEYAENTVKVLSPINENKDLTMYFGSGKYYKVRIIGVGGKVVGAGKLVKFKVNGKTYNVRTDKNGYASLKINLNPKKYTITAEYKGFKVSNKLTVKPVLTAKNVSKKSKKVTFQAKLVNTKGKPLAGKKITFKFKGKKYVAKTNSKGLATIKLTLKPGSYKIYSSYGKSKIKNTISIKK